MVLKIDRLYIMQVNYFFYRSFSLSYSSSFFFRDLHDIFQLFFLLLVFLFSSSSFLLQMFSSSSFHITFLQLLFFLLSFPHSSSHHSSFSFFFLFFLLSFSFSSFHHFSFLFLFSLSRFLLFPITLQLIASAPRVMKCYGRS